MRNHVIVAYDISDPKRLQRVHKLMIGYGDSFQKSVFACQLTEKDEVILNEKVKDIIDRREDQVILFRLGSVEHRQEVSEKWTVIGRGLDLPNIHTMIY